MKTVVTIIFFFNCTAVFAGTNYVVSPNEPIVSSSFVAPPQAGQNFFLWSRDSGCYTSDYTVEPETLVVPSGSDVRVFFHAGLGGSTTCVTPPPPRYLSWAETGGLNEGTYTLSTYFIPFADDFPPTTADYPIYLTDSFQFVVLGTPAAVNSTTFFGLLILISLLFFTGFRHQKHKRLKPT